LMTRLIRKTDDMTKYNAWTGLKGYHSEGKTVNERASRTF